MLFFKGIKVHKLLMKSLSLVTFKENTNNIQAAQIKKLPLAVFQKYYDIQVAQIKKLPLAVFKEY